MRAAIAALLGVGFILTVLVVGLAWTPVDEGEVGVVLDRGEATGDVLEPGWHYLNPITHDTVAIPTRPQTYTMSGSEFDGDTDQQDSIHVISTDGQEVHVDVTIRYRVEPDASVTFHEEYRNIDQAEERLIRPTVRSVMRDEGSAMEARNVITRDGRQALAEAAAEALREDFEGSGLTLEAVQVRNMHLNPEFEASLEQVQIAENYRQEEIIRAEADAEAYEIRAEALRDNPEVLVEAYIESLDRTDTVYVPVGAGGLPTYLPVDGERDGFGGGIAPPIENGTDSGESP